MDAPKHGILRHLPSEAHQMRCDASVMPHVHPDWSELPRTNRRPLGCGYDRVAKHRMQKRKQKQLAKNMKPPTRIGVRPMMSLCTAYHSEQ
jgi:hypothetical protein